MKLLTEQASSPKLAHSVDARYLSAVLYLSPYDTAGVGNVCPYAANCVGGCFSKDGRAAFDAKIPAARKARTVRFMRDRAAFLRDLHSDISLLERQAKRLGKTAVVRLNGLSDVQWHKIDPSLYSAHDVVSYDYTKDLRRAEDFASGKLPSNLHLTASYDGHSWVRLESLLAAGVNVAVAMAPERLSPAGRVPRSWQVPTVYREFSVVAGDATDYRFLDPPGSIVGLRAKGASVGRDAGSGFIVRIP